MCVGGIVFIVVMLRWPCTSKISSCFLVKEPPVCSLDKHVWPQQQLWHTFVDNRWWSQALPMPKGTFTLGLQLWLGYSLALLIDPLWRGLEGNVDHFTSHLFLADRDSTIPCYPADIKCEQALQSPVVMPATVSLYITVSTDSTCSGCKILYMCVYVSGMLWVTEVPTVVTPLSIAQYMWLKD